MLIVCPNCSTSYDVDGAKLGVGRAVRCARCKTTWQAAPVAEDVAAAEWEAALAEAPPAAAASGAREPAPPRGTAVATVPADGDGWGAAGLDAAGHEQPSRDLVARDLDEHAAAIAVSPPLVPADGDASALIEGQNAAATTEAERPDIESVAARRMRNRPKKSRRAPSRARLPLFIIVMVAILALLAAARVQVVRHVPQSAGLYAAIGLPVNLRGLEIEDVKTHEDMQDNVPVLVVEGIILNITKHTVDVPRLRFAVRSPAGLEVYAWTALPSQPVLGAGERLAFRSRLASPPPDTQDIVVRFFNRRDLEAVR